MPGLLRKIGETIGLLSKALPIEETDFVMDGVKQPRMVSEEAASDPGSLFYDPFAIIEQLGYKDKPTQITYGTLRNMVYRMPVVGAIINRRINQIAEFAHPQRNRYDMGYKLKLRDRTAIPGPVDRKWMAWFESFLETTGVTNNPGGRDNFETYLRKQVRDSLTYDQACTEIVPDMTGKPAEFYAVDSSSIRIADTATTYMNEDLEAAVRYVQIYDSMIVAQYSASQMVFGVRNPNSEIRVHGYGMSEMEGMVNVITNLLHGFTYNQKFFTQGSMPRGLINVVGAIPEKQLKAFRRHWYQMLSGVENCITGDTNIWVPQGNTSVAAFLGDAQEKDTLIWVGDSWKDAVVYKTKEPKVKVNTVLGNGVTLSTSPDHKFRIIGPEGEPVWARQANLRIGDFVLVNKIPAVSRTESIPKYEGKSITPELLEALGWFIGDGYFVVKGEGRQKPNYAQWFYHSTKERDICDRHLAILQEFEVNAHKKETFLSLEKREYIKSYYGFKTVLSSRLSIDIFSRSFVNWLLNIGFTPSCGGKSIPDFLYTLPVKYKAAFLKGLFSADGHCGRKRNPGLSIVNESLRNQVKLLLLSLGIRTCLSEGKNKLVISGKERFYVEGKSYLKIKDKELFFEIIGFLQAHKQPRNIINLNETGKNSKVAHTTILKYLRLVRAANDAQGKKLLTARQRSDMNSILTGQDGCSVNRLLRFMAIGGIAPPEWLISYNFEPVVDIIKTDEVVPMYDIEVKDDRHQFCANGVIISNSWRTPITNAEKMEWISLQQPSNQDMGFSEWISFNLRLACAFYCIDTEELGFSYGNEGQSNSLNEKGNKDKITESKSQGIRPILRHLAYWINKGIVHPLIEDFDIEFCGLDSRTHTEIADYNTKVIASWRTVNEIREEDGLPPLPGCDTILNASLLQSQSQAQAQAQMQQPGIMPPGSASTQQPMLQSNLMAPQVDSMGGGGDDAAMKSLQKSWDENIVISIDL